MGLMNYTAPPTSIWHKNHIEIYNNDFSLNDKIVALDMPIGKLIEIFFDGKIFKYSPDSLKEGDPTSVIGSYLEKFVYPKLKFITENFYNRKVHFYGYMCKTGFQGLDIYTNYNWLDWDLTESLYIEAKIKTIKVLHSGLYKDFIHTDSFIIRSYYERPDKRLIYSFKVNKQKG